MYVQTNLGFGQGHPVRPLTEPEVMHISKRMGHSWGDKFGNIDVHAQRAIVRLSKNPLTAPDAHALINAVKRRELRGIFIENQKAPALRAQKLGTWYGKLIPKGEDAVSVPAPAGTNESPLIAFRDGIKASKVRLDPALIKVWRKLRPASGMLHLEVAGLEAVEVLPTWEVTSIANGTMIARRVARTLSLRVNLNNPIRIVMTVPRPASLPPAGDWLQVVQSVFLSAPDGIIVPLGTGFKSSGDLGFASPEMTSALLHPLVTLEPVHVPQTLNAVSRKIDEGLGQTSASRKVQKMFFQATFIEVTKDVGRNLPNPHSVPQGGRAPFTDDVIKGLCGPGLKFHVFQETSRKNGNNLWAVAYHAPTLLNSQIVHCLLHLRHSGEGGKAGYTDPKNLNLAGGGLSTLWLCEKHERPFFIAPTGPRSIFDFQCQLPRAGFLAQLARAKQPVFIATPLTHPKLAGWFGLEKGNGRLRQRLENLARAVTNVLSVPQGLVRPIVSQMRLALAGWSFGAVGAIQVLKAHLNDVDELYWFDPPNLVAKSKINSKFLAQWLSRRGMRGPRFLRLIGGIENVTFQHLRKELMPFAKQSNVVRTMIADRFWENSSSYKLAISVPPSHTASGRFPESISCLNPHPGQVNCEAQLTPLSLDTGVFLSKIVSGGVEIVGKDANGKQQERLKFNISLTELKGLLRFAFLSDRTSPNPPNLHSLNPLYRGTGANRWNLAKLKRELERIVIGNGKFDNTIRHRWAIAGGVYPSGTPSIPTNGPTFVGFLQMCLEYGRFPKQRFS